MAESTTNLVLIDGYGEGNLTTIEGVSGLNCGFENIVFQWNEIPSFDWRFIISNRIETDWKYFCIFINMYPPTQCKGIEEYKDKEVEELKLMLLSVVINKLHE